MHIVKTKFETDSGLTISGVKIILAPKISKFFSFEIGNNHDNLMLIKTFNEVLFNWYVDANFDEEEDWNKFIEDSYNKMKDE